MPRSFQAAGARLQAVLELRGIHAVTLTVHQNYLSYDDVALQTPEESQGNASQDWKRPALCLRNDPETVAA